VRKAKHVETGEFFAIKIITKESIKDDEMLTNLKAEIETLKKVQHKNIIDFIEAFMTQANIHLVFEYYPHMILLDFISRLIVLYSYLN
jgi:5'-AMP-activated protein kinase catalytic alpha subunit